MQGIISILDEANREIYQQLLRDLMRDLGVRLAYEPLAHFSYHVSTDYDTEQLLPLLEQTTWQMEPFVVQVSGLGVFTGAEPVIYATIVRSRQLAKLQEALWDLADRCCPAPHELYHPDNWVPHITLLNGAELPFRMPYVMEWLTERNFYHQVLVNNISFSPENADPVVFPFGQT